MLEFNRPLPPMSLVVVGVDYRNADGSDRRQAIAACKPGEPVELRPEPNKRHDKQAVAVWSRHGQQLGYLSAERCGRIGALIESDNFGHGTLLRRQGPAATRTKVAQNLATVD